MKNIASFRKIIVGGKEYQWKYTFDDYDYQCASSLVIRSGDKKGKLVIEFRTDTNDHGYCPFNTGVSAINQNEPVI